MKCVCGKVFKTLKPFKKHRVLCEAKTSCYKKDITENEPTDDEIPSSNEVWKIVLTLIDKVDKVERKNKQLQQVVYKQNKNIDVLGILNNNFNPRHNYKIFIENIIFTDDDFKIIFNTNLITGITNIIAAKFLKQNIKTRPIQYFKEKKGSIYIYSIGKWREAPIKKGIEVVEMIYYHLLKSYNVYNKNRDENDTKFIETGKLMIYEEKKIKTYTKIHSNIIKELGVSARNYDDL